MKTGRTDTVGVVMTRVQSPFHAALLDTICRTLSASRLHMILWNGEHDSQEGAIEMAQRNLVDGVIFTAALSDSTAERAAVRAGVPAVLLHRRLDDLACDQVIGDNRGGSTQVGRYLAAAGHRRIGLVTGGLDASTIRDREEGFRAGLVESPPGSAGRSSSHRTDGPVPASTG